MQRTCDLLEAETEQQKAIMKASAEELAQADALILSLQQKYAKLTTQYADDAMQRARAANLEAAEDNTKETPSVLGVELTELLQNAMTKISGPDVIFLKHFLTRIDQPAAAIDPLVAHIASHFANCLGLQEYTTLANILHLPKRSWIKARRREIGKIVHIGFMPEMFDLICAEETGEIYCTPSDETRVQGKIEGVRGSQGGYYLVGEQWSPDPLKFPVEAEMHTHCADWDDPSKMPFGAPTDWSTLMAYLKNVHAKNRLASNVMLTGIQSTTNPYSPMRVIEVYPHACACYTLLDQCKAWWLCVYRAAHYESGIPRPREQQLRLLIAATDSCGTPLGAGLHLMTPNAKELAAGVKLLGLDDPDFDYFAKYMWRYPFMWGGDWDHAFRTGRRNLANPRVQLTFELREDSRSVASWGVLEHLKYKLGPSGGWMSSFLDYNDFQDQKSDASLKLFSEGTIRELIQSKEDGSIPEAGATILYLQAVHDVFAPFQNPNFGDPFEVATSTWAGCYIFRYQRAFVDSRQGLILKDESISTPFYNTIELMVHSATCYHLAAHRDTPEIPWLSKAPLRLVGDSRGPESYFSKGRYGTIAHSNSVNFTAAGFIQKLARIHESHVAKVQMQKHLIHISQPKGKEETWGIDEGTQETFTAFEAVAMPGGNPISFAAFKALMSEAKAKGKKRAQELIEAYAPQMKDYLKSRELRGGETLWEHPTKQAAWRRSLSASFQASMVQDYDPLFADDHLPLHPRDPEFPWDDAELKRCAGKQAEWEDEDEVTGTSFDRPSQSRNPPTLVPYSPPLAVSLPLLVAHTTGVLAFMGFAPLSAGPGADGRVVSVVFYSADTELDLAKFELVDDDQLPSWASNLALLGAENGKIYLSPARDTVIIDARVHFEATSSKEDALAIPAHCDGLWVVITIAAVDDASKLKPGTTVAIPTVIIGETAYAVVKHFEREGTALLCAPDGGLFTAAGVGSADIVQQEGSIVEYRRTSVDYATCLVRVGGFLYLVSAASLAGANKSDSEGCLKGSEHYVLRPDGKGGHERVHLDRALKIGQPMIELVSGNRAHGGFSSLSK